MSRNVRSSPVVVLTDLKVNVHQSMTWTQEFNPDLQIMLIIQALLFYNCFSCVFFSLLLGERLQGPLKEENCVAEWIKGESKEQIK
jgi:hypothetical protein